MNDLASVQPNQGKRLTIELDGVAYARYPLRTPLVGEGDDVLSVVRDAVQPYLVAEERRQAVDADVLPEPLVQVVLAGAGRSSPAALHELGIEQRLWVYRFRQPQPLLHLVERSEEENIQRQQELLHEPGEPPLFP